MVLHAQPADQPADAAPEEAFATAPETTRESALAAPLDFSAPAPFASSGTLRNPFPPIADYAFLSDWETTCLISPAGSVEWLCLPRPDSPSVFGAILDRTAGMFRFAPTTPQGPHQRRYIPGTMVLETTWHTPTGWLVVRDFLVVRPLESEQRRPNYRRAPGDTAATGTLVRIAECIEGRVELVVNIAPSFEYGAASGVWEYDG